MKEYEIKLGDWQRILFGEVPPEFYLEAALRIIFMYILVVFSMRKMGKRLSSHLSRNEMVATIALAAAAGIPVHTPERGLLPAVIVAFIVIIGQYLVSQRAMRSNTFERHALGQIATLVHGGYMHLGEMVKSRLSKDRVFSELRGRGYIHLGQVERLYFEANGRFSMLEATDPRPGLCVLPEFDKDFIQEQIIRRDIQVCTTCGKIKETGPYCVNCGKEEFDYAVEDSPTR
ncbi:DUF421 domain-containing protein [Filimonas effusa]|uniref:DUF421 domain-containing protein n=1 Tax=Filimonas effusa TaxID=2508721 RepID=A0A4Q1DAM0_9BACT|nr:YetF domain-containing protein [Filimonas effusa]RXK86451.1 DUF421 domain-containing protein [Filimonas effusa]